MSAQNLLSFFEELMNSPEKAGDIEAVTQKSMKLFNDIVDRLKNSSPSEREKIQNELNEAAQKMNQEFEKLCASYGMTREQLEFMVNDPSNFDDNTWSTIEGLKKEIQSNHQSFIEEIEPSSPNKKKKKKSKTTKGERFSV